MSNKKYKLLRDLPDADAGTVLTFTDEGDSEGYLYPEKFGRGNIWCRKDTVEQNPTWFQEVKPEKIEVMVWNVHERNQYGENYHYAVPLGYEIPKDKFHSIKKAIEFVLNDQEIRGVQDEYNGSRLYSESELNKARELAFNAAREGKAFSVYESQLLSKNVIYKTFEDYLKSLQP